MNTSQTIAGLKKALRKTIGKKLREVPPTVLASESRAVTAILLNSPTFQRAQNLSIYLSTSTSEIQTDDLVKESIARGKHVFIPYCPLSAPTVMKMLRLDSLAAFEGLKSNRWGIREHTDEEAKKCQDSESAGGLDLILVPGLAFDTTGQRLGHGRGYYDRFINATIDYPQRFSKPPPSTVALALSAQVLPDGELVPVEEWDRRPDLILTPAGVLHTGTESISLLKSAS
ncbi:5-formyltetrahydrofolate cyclo-ligase, partial [Meredithblackwellia eburnea MCA 4105]